MKIVLRIIGWYFNTLSLILPRWSAKQSFYLFAYPMKAKLTDDQQNFLNSAGRFKLRIEGDNVQYYKWGSGPAKILFVHGWQSNSYRWKPYVDAIDLSKYTVYAFDAPGHGNSESKFCNIPLYEKSISALIDYAGDLDHFVGHSIGSFALASYMFHHKYRVQSYVSLASPFDANEFLANYKERIALSERSQKYLAEYFESYTSHPISHYSLSVFAVGIMAERTLVIHDREDDVTPYQNAIKIKNLIIGTNRDVDMTITEGLKHGLKSDDVVRRVIRFLDHKEAYVSCN